AYPDIKGLADAPMDKRIVSFWGEALESGLEYVVLDNIEEANIPDFVKEFYKSIDTKSIIGIPIQSEQEKWGGFVLAQTDNYRHWTHNEIDLLKSISGQIYIAIKQAELYENQKQTAEREKLLKTISETIRSTLNIREVKKHAVREIAKTFQADRCFISEYTEENDKFAPIDSYSEYLLSPDTSSLEGYDWSTVLEIGMMLKEGKEIIFSKVDEVYELFKGNQTLINNTRKIFEDYNIKAGLVIPIFHLDKFLGILGFNYKTEKDLSEEEINLARALANQIGVALFQAKLYEKETQIARREVLINKVVRIIAEEPDIKVARNIILKEICNMLNADRCYFRVFNQNKQEFPAPEAEYVRTPEIKSLIDEPIKQEGLKFFFENAEKQKDYFPLIVNQKFLDEKNMRNTPLDEYFKECGIKTDIAIPMRDKENELSFLVLHYKEDVPNITEEEAAFLETLAKQIIIAVDRAKLLENTKKIARREKILRELVEEVRLSQSTIDIYNYIIAKTADIFDADRVCVSEKSEYSYLPAKIDYEFIRTEGMQSLSDIELPKGFLNIFMRAKDTLSLVDIDNLAEYMPEDAKLQQFFREYNLASMLVMPFIRYNSETKILGIIILFSSTPHKWTQDDKETLKAIAESTVRIIWEITKIREINEIRDIFTMTLAHDLQIPLIAEKKALEFLRSRPPDKPIGEFMEFLDIMARDNQSIVSLLNRLLYIYSYERGKRKLTLSVIPVLELIEETLDKLKNLIDEKSISISYEIDREAFKVLADREEIKRVICIILENAITYSHLNSIIRINCFMSDDKVITVIRDEGTGIPEYIRHKLFQRYQMVEIIERKIGSGLGLYLAKLIIEAHGGNIWYETVLNKGSAFYFSLPAAKEGK
ncbi:MAG: GAF domain-containing protein, partial [Candidatus Gastranaerophilales bacterium]|nr:GAF domain-containing protein [Candidatus Gastranaerophilales bacterium]